MIKAIETVYNGYRFRSRLEARWAVFFDTLGVKYEYEPQGFELSEGICYLPDFRVQCYGCRGNINKYPFPLYIEVKGCMTEKDAKKIELFADLDKESGGPNNAVLVVGDIPPYGCYADSYEMKVYESNFDTNVRFFNYSLIDLDDFGAYPAADKYGRFYLFGDDSSYINREDVDRVIAAYDKARQARFEHGERPNGG